MPDAESPRHRVLTPPGRAALAVVLVRGCAHVPPLLCSPAGEALPWPSAGRVVHARLVSDGHLVDDVVARGVEGGVELHVHGGEVVVASVCTALEAAGSRRDSDGADCVAPSSLRHARALASLRWGTLARLADEVRLAVARGSLAPALRRGLNRVRALRGLARRLESPPVVRLVGRPNAGKSTLFNALLSDDRALVSAREGTTRDVVPALFVLAGLPVRLEDTAGVRDGSLDRAGADLVVHVLDVDEPLPRGDHGGETVLLVRGKSDLCEPVPDVGEPPRDARVISVSGLTRHGVDELLACIGRALDLDGDAHDDVLAPVDAGLLRLIDEALALPDEPAARA